MDRDTSAQDDRVQRVRITSHGKIKAWVAFALGFLLDDASGCKPVVLDTLPTSVNISILPTDTTPRNITPARFHPSTSTISRLISVVEIIKREYLKVLATTHSTRLLGLHQYNEIGTLEDLGIVVASSNGTGDVKELESTLDANRTRHIMQAISGKHFTRQKQTPFMRITLSTHELPELIEKGATYQLPACRKLSRSAKGRARKRVKALQQSQVADRAGLTELKC